MISTKLQNIDYPKERGVGGWEMTWGAHENFNNIANFLLLG